MHMKCWLATVIYDLVEPIRQRQLAGPRRPGDDLRPSPDGRSRAAAGCRIRLVRAVGSKSANSTNPSWAVVPDLASRDCKPQQHGRRSRGKAGGVFPRRRTERLGGVSAAIQGLCVHARRRMFACWRWMTSWMAGTCCRASAFRVQRFSSSRRMSGLDTESDGGVDPSRLREANRSCRGVRFSAILFGSQEIDDARVG